MRVCVFGLWHLGCVHTLRRSSAVELAPSAPALMTVLRNEGRWDTSNVQFENGRVLRYDKRSRSPDMRFIDYGLTITEAAVLAGPDEVGFDLVEPYGRLAEEGRLAGYEITRRFYEIGTYAGMAETDAYLRAAASSSRLPASDETADTERKVDALSQPMFDRHQIRISGLDLAVFMIMCVTSACSSMSCPAR